MLDSEKPGRESDGIRIFLRQIRGEFEERLKGVLNEVRMGAFTPPTAINSDVPKALNAIVREVVEGIPSITRSFTTSAGDREDDLKTGTLPDKSGGLECMTCGCWFARLVNTLQGCV